jgi:regulator of replication initiation timing
MAIYRRFSLSYFNQGVMIVLENKNQEWYSNKDLFEMFQTLKDGLAYVTQELTERMTDLSIEMQRTTALMRQYNGLREVVDDYREEVQEVKEEVQSLRSETRGKEKAERFAWDKLSYIVGIAGVLVAIIALVVK